MTRIEKTILCVACGEAKPRRAFARDRKRPAWMRSGWKSRCTPCDSIYTHDNTFRRLVRRNPSAAAADYQRAVNLAERKRRILKSEDAARAATTKEAE